MFYESLYNVFVNTKLKLNKISVIYWVFVTVYNCVYFTHVHTIKTIITIDVIVNVAFV